MFISQPFHQVVSAFRGFLLQAPIVDVGEWQAQRGSQEAITLERQDMSFAIDIPESTHELVEQIQPSMPWAEEHFQERVSGVPYNPPPSAARWPYKRQDHAEHVDSQGRFSHTYPERLWKLSTLSDLIVLLRERPYTRQAFIPIWWPIDGPNACTNQRVPCTIGYHFLRRGDRLKIVYYIRSCDFLRHFKDDVYMAARLCQWMCDQLNVYTTKDEHVRPGQLLMHISSLHVFEADRQILEYHQRRKSL